jgi:hypothetical protein
LPGETGSTLSNLDLAIVCILGACANYFEAFNALKYSSSATFAGLPFPVYGLCFGCCYSNIIIKRSLQVCPEL